MSVIIRRQIGPHPYDADTICIALDARCIYRDREVLRLPPNQFRIAFCLLAGAGRVLTYGEIHDFLYADQEDGGPETNALKVRLFYLRKRLALLGISVLTIWGVGLIADIASRSARMRAA